ncbi:hypothetical protein BGZ76_008445, partial [Entomortierella beljakovae]
MQECTFRYLPNFNPAIPQDPNVTPELRAKLKEAYTKRLIKTAGETTKPVTRAVFLQLMAEANIAVPADLKDSTISATPASTASPVVDLSATSTSMEATSSETVSQTENVEMTNATEASASTTDDTPV